MTAADSPAEHLLTTDLLDVSGVPLAALVHLDDSPLDRGLRRVLADAERPEDALAGFTNSM